MSNNRHDSRDGVVPVVQSQKTVLNSRLPLDHYTYGRKKFDVIFFTWNLWSRNFVINIVINIMINIMINIKPMVGKPRWFEPHRFADRGIGVNIPMKELLHWPMPSFLYMNASSHTRLLQFLAILDRWMEVGAHPFLTPSIEPPPTCGLTGGGAHRLSSIIPESAPQVCWWQRRYPFGVVV